MRTEVDSVQRPVKPPKFLYRRQLLPNPVMSACSLNCGIQNRAEGAD